MFIERYFASGVEGWANFREVNWIMGQCTHARCTAPTRYLFVMDVAYIPTCEEHACELAGIVNDHSLCPNCNLRFVDPPEGPVGHVCTSCDCGPTRVELKLSGSVAGPKEVNAMIDRLNDGLRDIRPKE